MPDVFDPFIIEKHTGQGRGDVKYLRDKYGPGLSYAADPARFRIHRLWERSQVQTITLHFMYEGGEPAGGIVGAYFWPNSPPEGVRVQSNNDGNIDWNFSQPSFYDPRFEVGPYTFKANGLELRGLGSPSKNMPVNHDSFSFDIIVNPSHITPPVDPPNPPSPPPGTSDLDLLASYFSTAKTASESGLSLIQRMKGQP